MRSYYIRTDNYWQNSPDKWYGPFGSREEAQEEIDLALDTGQWWMSNQTPMNVRYDKRIYGIYPKSEALRMGLRSYALGHTSDNNPGRTLP